MCRSKIHRATITEANLNYVGSLTIEEELLELSNIMPYEQVHVVNGDGGRPIYSGMRKKARNNGLLFVERKVLLFLAGGQGRFVSKVIRL